MLDLNKLDSRTISIKHLAPGITEQQIYDRFSTYGHIKDISIVNNINNSLYACVKFEHELNAREATLQENGKIMDGVKVDVEHRLVVVSFEGDDAIKKPDPRVPSAAPPNTNNVTYHKIPQYPAYRQRNDRNSGNSILSPPPHPRNFSANQFYSPNHQFNTYGMSPATGFNGMGYYSMFGSGNMGGRAYAGNGYTIPFGYYQPVNLQNVTTSPTLGGNYSFGSDGSSPLSGGTLNSSPGIGSANTFMGEDSSAGTSISSSSVNSGNKDMAYYFNGNYAHFYPRHGSSIPMMGPYGGIVFNPGYYPNMQQAIDDKGPQVAIIQDRGGGPEGAEGESEGK